MRTQTLETEAAAELAPKRIALIEDHVLVRKALAQLIGQCMPGYEVVLECDNGLRFVEAMTAGAQVDIAIVDLYMPVMDGCATVAWIEKHHPAMRALILTLDAGGDAMTRAMRAGARALLTKDVEPAELLLALDTIVSTGYYHNERVHRHLLSDRSGKTTYEREREEKLAQLTGRELEFMKLTVHPENYSYKEMAVAMGVETSTAEWYGKTLCKKLEVRGKSGLMLFTLHWKLAEE